MVVMKVDPNKHESALNEVFLKQLTALTRKEDLEDASHVAAVLQASCPGSRFASRNNSMTNYGAGTVTQRNDPDVSTTDFQ